MRGFRLPKHQDQVSVQVVNTIMTRAAGKRLKAFVLLLTRRWNVSRTLRHLQVSQQQSGNSQSQETEHVLHKTGSECKTDMSVCGKAQKHTLSLSLSVYKYIHVYIYIYLSIYTNVRIDVYMHAHE